MLQVKMKQAAQTRCTCEQTSGDRVWAEHYCPLPKLQPAKCENFTNIRLHARIHGVRGTWQKHDVTHHSHTQLVT